MTTMAEPQGQTPQGRGKGKVQVIGYLLREAGILRDLAVPTSIAAGLGRTGLILGINAVALNGVGHMPSVALLGGATLVYLVSSYMARVRAFVLMARLQARARGRMSRALIAADADFLLGQDHGQVYAALTSEVDRVSESVLSVIEGAQAVLLLMICVPYLFWLSPVAGAATLVAIAIGTIGYLAYDVPARRHATIAARATATFCDRANDILGGWRELRLRATRRQELTEDTLAAIDAIGQESLRAEKRFSASISVSQAALAVLLLAIVLLIPVMDGGGSTLMFQVLTVVLLASGPIEALFGALPKLARAQASLERITQVENKLMQEVPPDGFARAFSPAQPPRFTSIQLRGVRGVIGHARTDAPAGIQPEGGFVLGPVDLELHPGEVVFVTGGNGSGKSTLIDIIAGLRKPDTGAVIWDGTPVDDTNRSHYRELFGAVFGNYHLFARTYGLNDDENARLNAAIGALGLSDRVQLAEGVLSTLRLSAGQRRRLALAMVQAEQRPVVMLDEFAADQDPSWRAAFYDVLVPHMAKNGQLVIAVTHDEHRFSQCDKLLRMHAGTLASIGADASRAAKADPSHDR